MIKNSLLLFVTHGTYGRDDDAFGAMLAANSALAKGLDVGIILMEDGVAMAKEGQDPNSIGLPNNLNEIKDFIDLGGVLYLDEESLKERGIGKGEIIKNSKIVSKDKIVELIEKYDLNLTF